MSNTSNRCFRCMHEVEAGASICPFCGYRVGKQEIFAGYLRPGTLLANRYLIGNVREKNSEYAIYAAFDQHLGVVVDIKEYAPLDLVSRSDSGEISPNEEQAQLFEQIGNEFANLHHILTKFRTMPNIIQVYSLFEQNNTCYAVLEHINGITLREYLADHYGELEWSEASGMFTELLKSVTHLHQTGILHGGFSPETLLVGRDNKLKITGFATPYLRSGTGELTPCLYDGYAAPEQYENTEIGPWTDVYGLAAVMYKTLTGTMPTASNTRAFNDNLIAPDILNDHVPKNVALALMSALMLSPKLRTQTLDDLFADAVTPPRAAQRTIDLLFDHESYTQVPQRDVEQQQEEHAPKNRKIIFTAMVISLSVMMIALVIIMFFLFGGS